MSQLNIGPFTYKVLKQNGTKVLLYWIESTGIQKERWVDLRHMKAGSL